MKVGTLLEELSKFDYDDNLVLYFLKNDELKSCQLESMIDANYEDDLIEEVTCNAGWCIKSIDYEIQLK